MFTPFIKKSIGCHFYSIYLYWVYPIRKNYKKLFGLNYKKLFGLNYKKLFGLNYKKLWVCIDQRIVMLLFCNYRCCVYVGFKFALCLQ